MDEFNEMGEWTTSGVDKEDDKKFDDNSEQTQTLHAGLWCIKNKQSQMFICLIPFV